MPFQEYIAEQLQQGDIILTGHLEPHCVVTLRRDSHRINQVLKYDLSSLPQMAKETTLKLMFVAIFKEVCVAV